VCQARFVRTPAIDPDRPPPGPFRAGFWRSPLRDPWLTAVLGLVLLCGIPVVALTGLFSNAAYQPRLGANALGRTLGPLDVYVFAWPTHPSWLYAFNQGLHVSVGLALVPVLLAKLWSVIPRLFEWPPVRSPAHALERVSLALLVGGGLFEFATGILDIQYWYPFHFFFTPAHYYGAWVFIGAFTTHVVIKFGTLRRSLGTRRKIGGLANRDDVGRRDAAGGVALTATGGVALAARDPSPATMSRRALLGTVGVGSVLLAIQGAGQSIGGPLRPIAFLAPRKHAGPGPNGFPVNRTAAAARIAADDVGGSWRLELAGRRTARLSRGDLLAMTQHSHDLPIACVEGWSTTQRWSGVRLSELAALVGIGGPATVETVSLERGGVFGTATLGHEQVADQRSLLALEVNGTELSLDHGFPARVISPAVPGVHCTKWVCRMTFRNA
jgi:DMSO/TMAO reductase YedYZ molybdopterin-dependent catalytic subunit